MRIRSFGFKLHFDIVRFQNIFLKKKTKQLFYISYLAVIILLEAVKIDEGSWARMCRKEKHKNFLKVFSLYGLNSQKIIRQTSLNSYYILYAAKVSICTPFLYNLTPRTNYMICVAQSKMKMQSPLFKNYLILCEIRPFNPMQGPSKHEALFSCTDCMLVKTALCTP